MKRSFLLLLAITSLVGGLVPKSVRAQDTFYYWVVPFPTDQFPQPNSFVIQTNAAQKAQIDVIYAQGHLPQFLGHVAAVSVDYNKDYYAPGQPVWDWSFSSLEEIIDQSDGIIPPEDWNARATPQEIAADPASWIAQNGDKWLPRSYWIGQLIDPAKPDAVANVSNRAFTGADEKTAITGFIISGGQPRNVIIRALGPSLETAGVQQFVANPKLEVHNSSTTIAQNSDWQDDARANIITETFPPLAPNDEREAALFLTLLPGAYTVLASSADGAEGVVLTEVYDAEVSP